jgi:hypothetical protein
MRKTLLEKLLPSMLEVVEKERKLYPNTIASLESSLQRTSFVTYLCYGDVMWLQSAASSYGLKFENVWDMFKED